MFYKYLSTILILLLTSVEVFSLPVPHKMKYDQSQQGEFNLRADLSNILVLFIPSGGLRFLDEQQLSSIISLLGNSRKHELNATPITSTSLSGIKDSPYKVDVDQSGIDRLHSDIDSLNTIIPITKKFNNAEKKEIDDKTSDEIKEEKIEEPKIMLENNKDNDKKEDLTTSKIETSSIPLEILTSRSEETSEQQKISTTLPPAVTTVSDITTSESVVTSTQLRTTSIIEKDKIKPAGSLTIMQSKPSSITSEDIFTKLKQRIIEPTQIKSLTNQQKSVSSSTVSSPVSSSTVSPSTKTPKLINIDVERERQIKALQTGLIFCLPGQKFNENGDCIDIQPQRESRQEDMNRLLSLLRHSIQPAGAFEENKKN